ncbi:hypothetical protein [Spiroplasma endosymbiont of Phyllotreta cruciferae]|uniref:hypothetical protein n=1 Tax=Spiroplasma endosymbiont of Phyllotreta cruciferae TaxID=2886375 RepID=UPI0020A12599|nr:hypothetical protein [Spiroplasma endosymbiont of Phyllotreta cruciferae]
MKKLFKLLLIINLGFFLALLISCEKELPYIQNKNNINDWEFQKINMLALISKQNKVLIINSNYDDQELINMVINYIKKDPKIGENNWISNFKPHLFNYKVKKTDKHEIIFSTYYKNELNYITFYIWKEIKHGKNS